MSGRSVAFPHIGAYLDIDLICGSDWPANTEVTLTIGDDHWTEQSDGDGLVTFDLEPFEVLPGQVVEMSDGTSSTTYIVVDLNVTTYDEINDTLSGTAGPGELEVEVCDDTNCETQYPIADGSGNWSVDLSVVDLAPGSYATLYQNDEDDNFTQNYWFIPDPYFTVSLQEGSITGYFWPANTEITLTIEDNRETWVGETNKKGEVVFDLTGFEILPDQELEMSGGTYTKTFIVKPLEVTDIDQDLDLVSGIAEPLSELEVTACSYDGETPTCETVMTSADELGNWQADFYHLVDISPGSDGSVQQIDEDEDSVLITWSVPFDDKGFELFLPIILR